MAGPRQEVPYLPEELVAERGPVLRRALRGLPDEALDALVRGVDRSGDRLAAGRLFRGSRGGCAVGVMLRELEPEVYAVSGPRFWLLHSWRRRVRWYAGMAKRNPRFQHLEWTFDRAAKALWNGGRSGLSQREAASAIGRWFRHEAVAELEWRRLAAGATSPAKRAAAPASDPAPTQPAAGVAAEPAERVAA
jgi:hypothetical protein